MSSRSGSLRLVGNLVELLRLRADEQPGRRVYTFLLDGEDQTETIDYATLDRRARAIAARLAEDLPKGARALLIFPPQLEYVAAFFGCLYAGAVAVPAYPPDPARLGRTLRRLRSIAERADADVILTSEAIRDAAPLVLESAPELKRARWIATDAIATDGADDWRPPSIPRDATAILQYTSGSTGRPKGVALSHGNVLAQERMIQTAFGHDADTVMVGWAPLFHDLGLIANALQPVYLGGTGVLMSPLHFLARPLRWLRAVSRYRGSTSGGPNFAFDLCVRRTTPEEREGLDLSSWTAAFNASEPVRADTCERFARTFEPYGLPPGAVRPAFGLAEATLMVSSGPMGAPVVTRRLDGAALRAGRVVEARADDAAARPVVGCGELVVDEEVVIADPETARRCAPGETGEIWIRGPHVALGYANDPERTAEVFGATLADGAGPFLRTGDLGFLEGRELFVTGRVKDMIIVRGANHYPEDLERVAEASHPALRPGCGIAFGVEVDGAEEAVVVHEVDPARLDDPASACERIREAVSAHEGIALHAVALIEPKALPKTSSGKLSRHACREAWRAGELPVVAAWRAPDPEEAAAREPALRAPGRARPPARAIEAWIAAWLAGRFGLDPARVGRHQTFDRFGVDSLAAVELASDLGARLGDALAPTIAWEHPSPEQLARHLAGEAREGFLRAAGPIVDGVGEPIAVVGIGCRLPGGAGDPERLWALLRAGGDAIREVPPERWDPDAVAAAAGGVDPALLRRGGFLDAVDRFDAGLFGIPAREADAMDPQQRILLEVVWNALEDAGMSADALRDSRTGVFVGISGSEYAHLLMAHATPGDIGAYTATGCSASVAAGRLAWRLGLRGPALAVDTACSSSLVAVHLACESLLRGECDAALAAGVSLMLSSHASLALARAGVLSARGRCGAFSSEADGYVRGEGCGVVVLQRLADARADGSRVLALVRGSAVNQDGRSIGITAPNGSAQVDVIRAALARAGVAAGDVDYVEAHGTGTPLGDPIEARALAAVQAGRPAHAPLRIGSVKANLGHLEAAAGLAGLLKVVLALQQEAIPAQCAFASPSPHVAWEATGIEVARALTPWPRGARRRLAGISSFGMSGTNAHVILEEAPAVRPEPDQPTPHDVAELLVLSAASEPALRELAARYAQRLDAPGAPALRDAAYTTRTGRVHGPHRLAVVAKAPGRAAEALRAFAAGRPAKAARSGTADEGAPRVAFLFTGQGSQYAGMGRGLDRSEPAFRDALDRAARVLDPILGAPLRDVLFGKAAAGLRDTSLAQPALFALEVALTELWRAYGVEPDAVLGHSVGEYAAAWAAGVIELEPALRLVAARGRLMGALPAGGGMLAVDAGAERVGAALREAGGALAIAAENAPDRCTVSGDAAALDVVAALLARDGIRTRLLPVSHAFHSPLLDPSLDALERAASDCAFAAPRVPLVSNRTGRPLDAAPDPAYWRAHAREPVRFAEGVAWLARAGIDVLVEIGPRPALLALAAQAAPAQRWLRMPTLREGRDARATFLDAVARIFVAGGPAGDARAPRAGAQRVALPVTRFAGRRHWLALRGGAGPTGAGDPLLGAHRPVAGLARVQEAVLSLETSPALRDHRVGGRVLLPAAALCELACAGGRELLGPARPALDDLDIAAPIELPETGARTVQLKIAHVADGRAAFTIESVAAGAGRADHSVCHASGVLAAAPADPGTRAGKGDGTSIEALRARLPELSADAFYAGLAAHALELGPAFQGLVRVFAGEAEALAELRDTGGTDGALARAARLDAALQAAGAALLAAGCGLHLPVGAARVEGELPAHGPLFAHALRRPDRAPGVLRFDVSVLDAGGCEVARVLGLQLRRADAVRAPDAPEPYALVWRPCAAAEPTPSPTPRVWLVAGGREGVGAAVVRRLEARGDRCLRLPLDARPADGGQGGDAPAAEVALELERIAAGVPLAGAVYLPALDARGGRASELRRTLRPALSLVQALVRTARAPGFRLILATRGAQPADGGVPASGLAQAPLWGLGRVVQLEHPELGCVLVDLDPAARAARDPADGADCDARDAAVLADALAADTDEDQLAIRDGARLAPRLEPLPELARRVAALVAREGAEAGGAAGARSVAGDAASAPAPERRAHVLGMGAPGRLDTLRLEPAARRTPADHEVEIAVRATGLNFRDVLGSLGMLPGQRGPAGLECAGFVVRRGAAVTALEPGQEVVALATGAFASHVVADSARVVSRPARVSPEAAAALPVAYLTAHHALVECAALAPGERVLIHSAAGGVGMAAVQLALRLGARVYATASPEKWDAVKALGVEHVMHSRSLDFAAAIRAQTGGRGVDVVLNALTGECIPASLSVLAPGGRFVELGKLGVWSAEQVAAVRPDVAYHTFDLLETPPARLGERLDQILREVASGALAPLPHRSFTLEDAALAFRFMARARHVGKVVLTQKCEAPGPLRLDREGSYLVTGGLGALGLRLAAWLHRRGAGRVVLVSRRPADAAQREALASLRAAGAHVEAVAADVAERAAVAERLHCIARSGRPLRGVIHAAGVLDDGVIERQTWARVEAVLRPKVHGALHLHELSRGADLHLFALVSSAASVLGSPGQSGYAAANAFLDALAWHRRAEGLPATSVCLGALRGGGMAAAAGARADGRGLGLLEPEVAVAALEALLGAGPPQAAVLDLDADAFVRRLSGARVPAPLRDRLRAGRPRQGPPGTAARGEASLAERLADTASGQRRARLVEWLAGAVQRMLELDPGELPAPTQPLRDLGLDSLMAVELRNEVAAASGVALPSTALFDYPTLEALADHLLERLGLAAAAGPAPPADAAAGAATDAGGAAAGGLEGDALLDAIDRTLDALDERLCDDDVRGD